MNAETILLVAIMIAFVLVAVQLTRLFTTQARRVEHIQNQFVPGYLRSAFQGELQYKAGDDLVEYTQQVRSFNILPLSDEQKNHFTREWLMIQVIFAQNPKRGIREAEHMLRKIMRAKGYPVEDFSQLTTALSLDFPAHVMQFRKLHLLAMRNRRDNLSPEDMSRAMRQARILFEEILYADLVTGERDSQLQGRT